MDIKTTIGYIYKITSPTGSVYIGQTKNFKKRVVEYKHLHKSNRQLKISNSIEKYGFENHIFEIIEQVPLSDLWEREMYWIEFYKSNYTLYPENNGLNLTKGGKGDFHRGRQLSKEHKLKIGKSHLGKTMSEESKKKCGDSMRGKKHRPEIVEIIRRTSTGRALPQSAKEKLRKLKTGSRCPHVWKPVKMIDVNTGEVLRIFNCVADVATFFNKKRVCLHAVCTGKVKTQYGYKWQYDLSLNKLLRRA